MQARVALGFAHAFIVASGLTLATAPAAAQCQVDALRPLPPSHEMRWLCTSGNRMVVSGESLDNGLRVLVQQGGDWLEEAFIVLPGLWFDSAFGGMVVLEGDTLAVGAPYTTVAGQLHAGSVLVYRQVLGTWSLEQELFPPAPVERAGLGGALALEGDTLVVGEAFPVGPIREGRVHVFVRQGALWNEEAVLTGPGVAGDFFGKSLALRGARLAVGAPRDAWSTTSSGDVYVFEGSGATWSEPEVLSAGELPPSARFGCAVALDGETLAVSSEQTGTERCSAFVFVHGGGGWSRQARMTLSMGSTFGGYAPSLGLVGDRLLVGHPRDLSARSSGGFQLHAGAVYLFARSGDVWTQADKLYGDDTDAFDGFGKVVSWEGGLACVAGGENAYLFTLDDPDCPRARFVAAPSSGSPPLAVAFTDQSTGNVTSWEWSFGDGASATAQHPSHTYMSGRYTVSLVARSAFAVDREIAVDLILAQTAASATVRNGSGVNDLCYASTSLPLVGGTWTPEVDASAHAGASMTFLLGYLRPSGLVTPRGEILIDLTSARIFGVTAVPDGAGIAHYSLPIPNDLSLEGLAFSTQAGIIGSIELCNAVDLVLGF